jgi:hypothetical protein
MGEVTAAIYARVSTEQQTRGNTVASQLSGYIGVTWQFAPCWQCRATIKVRKPDNQDEKVVALLVS